MTHSALTQSEKVVEELLTPWDTFESNPEKTLLRLALLREVARALHSQKSRLRSTGEKTEVLVLQSLEDRVTALRNQENLNESRAELLSSEFKLNTESDPNKIPKQHLIPEQLLLSLDREKLVRPDRKWEERMAAEAVAAEWRFWSLDAWVTIAKVEEWASRLSTRIWPKGIILFVESIGITSPLWHGKWILMLHPSFTHPEKLSHELSAWSGTPDSPPSPMQWKLLYRK